jgi:hypothetical protein
MGVDEIYRGRSGKFLTVVCNPETGEACCVDMWKPFGLSLEQ